MFERSVVMKTKFAQSRDGDIFFSGTPLIETSRQREGEDKEQQGDSGWCHFKHLHICKGWDTLYPRGRGCVAIGFTCQTGRGNKARARAPPSLHLQRRRKEWWSFAHLLCDLLCGKIVCAQISTYRWMEGRGQWRYYSLFFLSLWWWWHCFLSTYLTIFGRGGGREIPVGHMKRRKKVTTYL